MLERDVGVPLSFHALFLLRLFRIDIQFVDPLVDISALRLLHFRVYFGALLLESRADDADFFVAAFDRLCLLAYRANGMNM